MSKTAEDYFKERFSKHEQKIQRFDYYDMVYFADQYAQQRVSELERTVRNLEVDCDSYKLTIDMEMERVKELEKENDELKMRIISQMITLSNFQNGLSRDLGINPAPAFYSDAERHVKQLEQSNKELVEANKFKDNQIDELSRIVNKYALLLEGKDKLLSESFTLSRKRMPDFDGQYYVFGYMHHSCGNVTSFHKIVECKNNQWVKSDVGEQMTYWRHLFPEPEHESEEFEEVVPDNKDRHDQN